MKIYDCFMYHNEDVILDLRLNFLNEFVDFFIIVESKYNHKGEEITLNLNDTNRHYKKIIKPTEEELKLHKEYLKTSLKKNFFN